MATKLAKVGPLGGAHTSGIYSDMTVDGPEIGTLVVIFDRAKNLPNRRSMGKQDPYCAARLGKEAKKTNTDRRGGQTPRWDQELRFTVHDSIDYLTLKVSVFNDDKKTELIGETYINLQEVVIPGGGQSDIWHPLNCKGRYAGEIRIELTYYDSRPKPEKTIEAKPESSRGAAGETSTKGPREITPVKRRPLPSNPTGTSPSPLAVQIRAAPQPVTGPRSYQTPTRQQPPAPSRAAEPTSSQKRHSHYVQPSQPMVDPRQAPEYLPNPSKHQDAHELHLDTPYERTPDRLVSSGDHSEVHRPSPLRSYGRADYEPQPIDAMPPVPSHSSSSIPTQQDYAVSSHISRQRPHSFIEPQHAHSAPIVPTTHGRRSLYHAKSEDNGYRQPSPLPEDHHNVHNYHQNQSVQHEPQSYHHSEEFDTHRQVPDWREGYNDNSGQNPFQNPYESSRPDLQPTVEDEDDIPPPPPVHRSSAPAVYQIEQQYAIEQSSDLAPAPLRVTPSRDDMRRGSHGIPPQQTYEDQTSHSPYERRYIHPHERPVSRDTSQPSPLRHEVPVSLMAGPNRPREEHRMSMKALPSTEIPQQSSYQVSPYETPVAQRQVSHQDFQTPPNYNPPSRSPRPHEDSGYHQQYHGSPSTDPYSSQDAAPMIKPRAVSPAVPVDTRHGRGPSRSTPTRKSVSPRPPVESERRLSNIPFSPDDFDAFNPNATPSSSRGAGASAGNSNEPTGPIVGFDGRVIDPSDHLPVDTYAPEPERKGAQKAAPLRERDRLTGAREIGRRNDRDTSSSFINETSPGAMVLSSQSANRNRLHKRPPHTPSGTPNSAPGSGVRDREVVHHTQYSPSPYAVGMRRDAGNRMSPAASGPPPIPAKIPISSGDDMSRLSEEISRIDIGAGSSWRNRQRGGEQRGRRY